MKAVLASLAVRRPEDNGRRIVALTDMLELGPDSPRLHAELAEAIEGADVHLAYLAGPHMKSLWKVLPKARRGAYAETADELARKVAEAVRPGDLVMVKGSNGSKASLIANALAGLDFSERETA